MFGLAHFLSSLIGHIVEVVVVATMWVRFRVGAWLKTPAGLHWKQWCRTHPALVIFTIGATFYLFGVILPILDGIALFHAGHKAFTVFDLIIGGALVAFAWKQWSDGLRMLWGGRHAPRTIHGTARAVRQQARQLAGKGADDDR